MKNVLVIYERKSRELETAVLLKLKLQEVGIKCDLAQFYELSSFYLFSKKNYDLIIVPHLYDSKEVFRTLTRYGKKSRILNLQYEQVLSKKWEDLGHHNPSGLAKFYPHVCWGKETEERLIAAGVPHDNVYTVGAMQLDLLQDSDVDAIKKHLSVKFDLPRNKKWKLFLSSFTYADISDEKLRQNEAIANTNLSYFKDIHSRSRDNILNWFSKVLSEDKDSILIYRPHPDEANFEKIKKLEFEFDNFKVIEYSSAKDWIQSCDLIISWYSTTVVESHFLDKPYAILRPLELPDDFDSVLLKKGKFITSFEEFKDEVYFKNNFSSKALLDQDIFGYYGIPIGSSVSRVVNLICDIILLPYFEVNKIPLTSRFKLYCLVLFIQVLNFERKIKVKFPYGKYLRSLSKDISSQIATKYEKKEQKIKC